MPAGQVVVSSSPLDGDRVPGETTVWLRLEDAPGR
jgi:hypothetical protein